MTTKPGGEDECDASPLLQQGQCQTAASDIGYFNTTGSLIPIPLHLSDSVYSARNQQPRTPLNLDSATDHRSISPFPFFVLHPDHHHLQTSAIWGYDSSYRPLSTDQHGRPLHRLGAAEEGNRPKPEPSAATDVDAQYQLAADLLLIHMLWRSSRTAASRPDDCPQSASPASITSPCTVTQNFLD
ncbi:hypothetical protein E6O75_ATG04562 [Venturia nashicola]|uniref:Uncharacterized protein n=1 Tax=Venturia nashicola TaxID=86259 RepID=A0A4Z1P8A5_9PEZI|nr:hypothetical protein E6O75_ATG04562 [Venturia nashicola]